MTPIVEPEIIESVFPVEEDAPARRRRPPTGIVLAGVITALALAGALAGGLSVPGGAPTSASPTPTPTAGSPAATPPAAVAQVVTVQVSGSTCRTVGPSRVPAGSAVTFHLSGADAFTVDAVDASYAWQPVLSELNALSGRTAQATTPTTTPCAAVSGDADLTVRLDAGLYAVRYRLCGDDATHLAVLVAAA